MKATIKLGFLFLFMSIIFACAKIDMVSQVLEERQDFITDKIQEETEIATIKEPIENKRRILTAPNPTIQNSKKEEYAEGRLVMFEEIEAKIVFNSGQYAPNEKGMENIKFVFKDLKADLLEHKELFPDDVIVLEIIVKGYSDNHPFYQGQSIVERKKMNKKMSHKRAKNVGDFLKDHLETYVDEVDEVLDARGEELPLGMKAGTTRDARRRVCMVDLRVYVKK